MAQYNPRPGALLGLLISLVLVSAARADTSSSSLQHVYVEVLPTVLVGESDAAINLGRIGTGNVCASVRWRIDANQERVRFTVGASDLWKGGNPASPNVEPIRLDLTRGVVMDVEAGAPLLGEDGNATFTRTTMVHEYPTWVSESVVFESSQAGRFSQYLTTILCWTQDDPEKPRGGYGGMVHLWVMVMPRFY